MKNVTIPNVDLIARLAPQWQLKHRVDKVTLDNQHLKKRFELNSVSTLIVELCDGEHSLEQVIESLCAQFPAAKNNIPTDVENVVRDLHQAGVLEFTPQKTRQSYRIPKPTAPHKKHKLCIGMATYDDYDGVYFSIQAIRLYHPEILEDSEIIVIDNHPDGPCSKALKDLGKWVKGYRYVPCAHIQGTSVRNLIFQEANADYVMCIDSHVMIQAGAIKRLLEYFDDHPKTPDFLQGPLLNDNMTGLSSHFKPEWNSGMYGTWGYDERAEDINGLAFDIPMQGLGLFACRRLAWLGFNSKFSGFGGEEGYIHEKFRQAGARTLCLPFLRWVHRFVRPMGTQYTVRWEDRIRNYLIGHHELGLDSQALIEHFIDHVGEQTTQATLKAVEAEIEHPLFYFDAIFCLVEDTHPEQWAEMQDALAHSNVVQHVKPYAIDADPEQPGLSELKAHREIFNQAQAANLQTILVLDARKQSRLELDAHLVAAISELSRHHWNLFYFEPYGDTKVYARSELLLKARQHGVSSGTAYQRDAFNVLLDQLPTNDEASRDWLNAGNRLNDLIEQHIDHRLAVKN